MSYETDHKSNYLLTATPVLLAIYSAAVGHREIALIFLAAFVTLLIGHEAYAYWPKLTDYLRHRAYRLWHHYQATRT